MENEHSFKYLDENTISNMKYGVIMPDGLYLECKFGNHIATYGTLMLEFIRRNYDKTPDKLKDLRGDHVSDVVKILSYYSENDKVKYDELSHVTFINAKNEASYNSDLVKKHAENWFTKNGKIIWGIRTLLFISSDKDFFFDNSIKEYQKLFRDLFNSEYDLKQLYKEYYSAYEFRFELPEKIISILGNDLNNKEVEKVIDLIATYRSLLNKKATYSSAWDENFINTDLDQYVFKDFKL